MLLIRRRPRGDWGIPKGMIDPGHTAPEAAAIEAFEEAGIEGELLPKTLGAFEYPKFGRTCHVDVFGLRVTRVHDHYDEERLRERRWFPLAQRGATGEAARRRPLDCPHRSPLLKARP